MVNYSISLRPRKLSAYPLFLVAIFPRSVSGLGSGTYARACTRWTSYLREYQGQARSFDPNRSAPGTADPPTLQATRHLLKLPQQLRQDPGCYKASFACWPGFPRPASHVRQSLCNQRRQHPDLAKDPWPSVLSDDDAVCALSSRSFTGCSQAWAPSLEKRLLKPSVPSGITVYQPYESMVSLN